MLFALIEQVVENTDQSTNSIAVQAFDATDSNPLFQWTYTGNNLNPTLGVRHVDQNTVFRVGSVSKIWAMYLFLVKAGLEPFAEPITKYIPELQAAISGDAINSVQWANVTIGELASHLAGIGRDCECVSRSLSMRPLNSY